MDDPQYVEDKFIAFCLSSDLKKVSPRELAACENFYELCMDEAEFTEKQASYIKIILKKYYSLNDPDLQFKKPFRTLDVTTSVTVYQSDDDQVFLEFKFPYHLLEKFDEVFETSGDYGRITVWDSEKKVRKLNINKANFFKISNFVNLHSFAKSDSYLDLEAQLQESINNQELLIPHSVIEDGEVILKNSDSSSLEYFEQHKTDDLYSDALLAKIMGYPVTLISRPKSCIEKIISSKNQFFWMKNIDDFFDFTKTIKSKTCIIIDRDEKEKSWLKNFIEQAKETIPNKKIKICFRETQDKDREFNEWIKETGTGGKVDDGDLYIFQHKPPKWIIKERKNIMFIATTMINPPSNTMTQDFYLSSPCVIHLGDIKPTSWRNRTIVEL